MKDSVLVAIAFLSISILGILRLGPDVGLNLESMWPYVAVASISFVSGFLISIRMMHYKESGSTNKILTHVAGNFAQVAKSNQTSIRAERNSLTRDKQRIAMRENELNRKARELDKRELELNRAAVKIQEEIREKLDNARKNRRIVKRSGGNGNV